MLIRFFQIYNNFLENFNSNIGVILCYLHIHYYHNDAASICYRCSFPNPIYNNAQTRKVLFEKLRRLKRRKIAKR